MKLPTSRVLRLGATALVLSAAGCKEKPKTQEQGTSAESTPSAPGEKTAPVEDEKAQWAIYTRQADELAAKNELVDAVAMYREALKLKADYVKARTNLGSALMRLERYGEAATEFSTALETAPDLAAAHLNLASILLLDGRNDDALPHLVSALATAPDVPEVQRNLGLVYFQKSDFDKSIQHYRRLSELLPKEVKPLLELGRSELAAGRSEDGIATLKKATELSGASAEAYHALAWALATHREGGVRDGAEAKAMAEKAVSRADAAFKPNALRALAAACAELGDFEGGKTAIQQAIALVEGKDQAAEEQLYEDFLLIEGSRPIRD
jgi:tetratricopeptide (TPR) repeat protein